MSEAKETDAHRLALAAEAKRLLEDPLFNAVVSTVLKQYIDALLKCPIGSPEAVGHHAGMKALSDIKASLGVIVNDGAMVKAKNR